MPGYDTHGLPLELKALASMKARRGSLTPQQVREGAKREAEKGIEVQAQEFSEFGGMGAFGTGEAYRTLDWSYEKRQLGVFKEMARKGLSERSLHEVLAGLKELNQSDLFGYRSDNDAS